MLIDSCPSPRYQLSSTTIFGNTVLRSRTRCDNAAAVRRVLSEPSYAQRARALQSEIAQCHPLDTITEVLLELAS